jgi:hypothetical protein
MCRGTVEFDVCVCVSLMLVGNCKAYYYYIQYLQIFFRNFPCIKLFDFALVILDFATKLQKMNTNFCNSKTKLSCTFKTN